MIGQQPVQLGLIGDNIAESLAPRLHERAGALLNLEVCYHRLVPSNLDLSFEAVFDQAKTRGYRGLNITYPYKERVVSLLKIADPRVARLGAVNTVIFGPHGPEGYNTDWSGFIAGYRNTLRDQPAGNVAVIGAGGVGRAIAFALLDLGVSGLRIVDRDPSKAQDLAARVRLAAPGLAVSAPSDLATACAGVQGVVNCTPVGMVGLPGTPVPRHMIAGAIWAFDAVYTPPDTQFLQDAAAEGLHIYSGADLFFYQGLHAISHFHGRDIDEALLRDALAT
ncbi:shikimate dehydrogenase [Pseudoruegeria sp. SK021]|uniref:shikimate dehydrogenase family protein n=1 Tax=Pseudoruegeria sp. SK021 TaxID=1933035 RepID=UPI000A2403C6|nr:shikimate dehydrogenase [Pseudoruegeria sp. SK021]OSP56774.1 shikimate dehydrogenase [Pseudoruegeria sp. SK021]